MSPRRPRTLEEWSQYAATLDGEALREKTIAANSASFVRALQEEGYDAAQIHTIFGLIARRFPDTGQVPPPDGLYDLGRLARDPLPSA